MCRCSNFIVPALLTVAGIAAVAGSVALTQPAKEKMPGAAKPAAAQPAGQPDMQLPPGWSAEDMQACTEAGTPGQMHEVLAKRVGTWSSKTKMWMAPGTEAMASEGTYTCTSLMDGRYVHCEMKGEMPGMGMFHGAGLAGFDNVSQKFVGNRIDNHSTGIMNGTGTLSADSKTLNWTYTHNCPLTKKPQTLREVETMTGPNNMTLEMYGPDRASGKEFKMMEITFSRTGGAPTASKGH